MANLCIIPARGGSKRIPRKNIREFMGKPMLAYPICNALESGLFDEVMVSTDDEEIAETARKYNASVPFLRADTTAGDTATTAAVIEEVLRQYDAQNRLFEYVCCLYPCTPLLRAEHLIKAYRLIEQGRFHTVLSVQSFDFPVQRALKSYGDEVRFLFPEHALTRSQDLETLYHDAGQFYWLSTARFLTSGTIIGDKCGYLVLSGMEGQDIDNEEDWKMAELKFKMNYK